MKSWHWYKFRTTIASSDFGSIQISVDGGAWETISSQNFDGDNPAWTQHVIDLSAYAGLSVRIAFYFNTNSSTTDAGWYIDDISIEKI